MTEASFAMLAFTTFAVAAVVFAWRVGVRHWRRSTVVAVSCGWSLASVVVVYALGVELTHGSELSNLGDGLLLLVLLPVHLFGWPIWAAAVTRK